MTLREDIAKSDQEIWEMLVWANDPGNYMWHDNEVDPWDYYSALANDRLSFKGWLYWNWNKTNIDEARGKS